MGCHAGVNGALSWPIELSVPQSLGSRPTYLGTRTTGSHVAVALPSQGQALPPSVASRSAMAMSRIDQA
jgi:hypothetical protein